MASWARSASMRVMPLIPQNRPQFGSAALRASFGSTAGGVSDTGKSGPVETTSSAGGFHSTRRSMAFLRTGRNPAGVHGRSHPLRTCALVSASPISRTVRDFSSGCEPRWMATLSTIFQDLSLRDFADCFRAPGRDATFPKISPRAFLCAWARLVPTEMLVAVL